MKVDTKSKILASLTAVVGGLGVILTALVAFGVHITPDQHTAIIGVGSLVLVVAGAWFHPSVPFGSQP